MRGQLAWAILAGLSLAEAVAVDTRAPIMKSQRRGILDGILGALTGNRNNNAQTTTVTKENTVTKTVMSTVTMGAAASGGAGVIGTGDASVPFANSTAAATMTVTQVAPGGVAAGASQLMIVTTTVFEGGAPPTVTITELASTVTQTICQQANPAVSAAPGSNADPNAETPVIVSGATSNHGIVIVSLPGTTGPTTTHEVEVSATLADPAASEVVETSLASGAAPPQLTAPTETIATSVALPSSVIETTESLQPLPTAETSPPQLESTVSTEVPAAESTLESSIELGPVGGTTTPAAADPAAPEITSAPGEVQNPAAGSSLTLDNGVSLASQLTLGPLGG